jgi:hypothetical protein
MEAVQLIDQGWHTYGYLGVLATLLTAAVGLYKQPVIQNLVPAQMKWLNLKPVVKVAVIFVAAGAGSGLLAYLGGASVAAAVGLGISAGFAAIGIRETKETLVSKPVRSTSKFRNTSLKTKLELPRK